MVSRTIDPADADSLYCNPTEDGRSVNSAPSIKSTKSSSSGSSSVNSGSRSTKSRSTTRSKSSTSSAPKSPNWKAAMDPMGMSTKSMGSGFMFDTQLYSPGFHAAPKKADIPKSFQNKQLKFVEKRSPPGSSAGSTKSGRSRKSEKSTASSSNKSVKSSSSSSSTKTTFLSSLTGNFSSQGDSAVSLHIKKTEETETQETETPKAESEEVTKSKKTDDSSNSKNEAAAATDELLVVVEDHSTQDHSSDTLHMPELRNTPRRPSIAESITHLRTPTQRPQHTPNELLLKRVISWEYLGRVHDGNMVYYNTTLLTGADLRRFYSPELLQKRTHHYFSLGNSIATALDIPNVSEYARTLSTILHEYEDFISTETKPKMNFFKGSRKILDHWTNEEAGEFSHFEVRTVPFEMDYTIVFGTLCEMISKAYKKFDTQKADIIVGSEVFHKIDVRLKKILNNATRELEALTREVLQEELFSIDPLAGFGLVWDQ